MGFADVFRRIFTGNRAVSRKHIAERGHYGRRRRHLLLEGLEDRRLMAGVTMTGQEQLLLELINRGRQDPTAEVARYGISLNQGLAAGTITTAAKQPLAPNQFLTNAAGLHSQDMLNNDYFSHTNLAGQSPSQRAAAAGYSGGVGENIAWGGSTGTIDQNQHVYQRHESLILSAGHRTNIMNPSYDELGNGVRYGVYTVGGTNYNASMVTENFGISSGLQFITGVAYTDAVAADNFYTIGEQEANLTVRAVSSSGATFETQTGPSGGYALSVPTGTYTVTFTGGSHTGQVSFSNVVVSGLNVKVDLDSTDASWGTTTTPPPTPSPTPSASFAADVNADGIDDIVSWANNVWLVTTTPTTGSVGQSFTQWSTAVTWSDLSVGDFNADGRADVVGRANGNWWVGISNGTSFVNQYWGSWAPTVTWVDVSIGDFNGDGRDDLVGRTSGNWWLAVSTGSGFVNQYWGTWSNSVIWSDVQVGDFNGDGRDDVAGRANGGWWLGVSSGIGFSNQLWTGWANNVTWESVRVGDFNGDGRDDIAGRTSGTWWVAISTGTQFSNQLWGSWSNAVTWADVQVGDFNNDGSDDIIGRTGSNWWLARGGSSFTNLLWGTWATNVSFTLSRRGDFDGDGRDDMSARGNGTLLVAISTI